MSMEAISYWHWWILAAALVILEVFAPGAFFLWLGIAAAALGLLVYAFPAMGWEYQVLIFSLLSVISIILWRRFFRSRPGDTDQPALNRRGEQYIGRHFTLGAPLINGVGKIRVDDSTWKIHGEDCPAGTRVEVIGVEGTVLKVERRDEHAG